MNNSGTLKMKTRAILRDSFKGVNHNPRRSSLPLYPFPFTRSAFSLSLFPKCDGSVH
jgi:hypothetical protein